jgi:hypothetical protein
LISQCNLREQQEEKEAKRKNCERKRENENGKRTLRRQNKCKLGRYKGFLRGKYRHITVPKGKISFSLGRRHCFWI